MKKTFSAWALKGENIAHALVCGLEPIRFANGEVDEECEVMLYSFEAYSHEEAMSIYYIRQGWAPISLMGKLLPAPSAALCIIQKAVVNVGNATIIARASA